MIWHSQCGQDKWVYDNLGPGGTFLDIGCGDPILLSNTYALEQVGWTGTCIDIQHFDYSKRVAKFIHADAVNLKWNYEPDYISLDVDWVCLQVLKNLIRDEITFKALTIEHNRYCKGDDIRNEMRTILFSQGYTLEKADVAFEGNEFEDWWLS